MKLAIGGGNLWFIVDTNCQLTCAIGNNSLVNTSLMFGNAETKCSTRQILQIENSLLIENSFELV